MVRASWRYFPWEAKKLHNRGIRLIPYLNKVPKQPHYPVFINKILFDNRARFAAAADLGGKEQADEYIDSGQDASLEEGSGKQVEQSFVEGEGVGGQGIDTRV